jgi:hypothetical protein
MKSYFAELSFSDRKGLGWNLLLLCSLKFDGGINFTFMEPANPKGSPPINLPVTILPSGNDGQRDLNSLKPGKDVVRADLPHGAGFVTECNRASSLQDSANSKKLADAGNSSAQSRDGIAVRSVLELPINLNGSASLCKLFADHGNRQYNYGICLHHGIGIRIDLARTAQYYKLSADQGNAFGQYNYGFCLHHGIGIPIDLAGSAHYYKLSADQGNSYCQNHYALCLHHGLGISIDLNRAFHLYKL